MAEWITLDTHHGPVRAWQALPEGTARGGLVVVQEIFGANPHIRSVAERFAAEGYAVLAPSFFDLVEPRRRPGCAARRRGREAGPGTGRRAGHGTGAGGRARRPPDWRPTARSAPSATAGRHGGDAVRTAPGAAVGQLLRCAQRAVPRRGAQGPGDLPLRRPGPQHPPEAVQAHRELPQMATYVYPADHAFNREVGHAYDPDSAALALQRTLDFFSEHLG